jgi:hypothetical protein
VGAYRNTRSATPSKSKSALLSNFERLRKLEADSGLGGQDDFFVPGKCGTAGTRASTGRHANRSAFAPASECSNDTAKCSASAGHNAGAFALALYRESAQSSLNGQVRAVEVN